MNQQHQQGTGGPIVATNDRHKLRFTAIVLAVMWLGCGNARADIVDDIFGATDFLKGRANENLNYLVQANNTVDRIESDVGALTGNYANIPSIFDAYFVHLIGPNWNGIPTWNLENIYNSVGSVSATVGIISSGVDGLYDHIPAQLNAYFAHIIGPNWNGLPEWNLENIYTNVIRIPGLGTKLDNLSGMPAQMTGLGTQLAALQTLPGLMTDVLDGTQGIQDIVLNVQDLTSQFPSGFSDDIEDAMDAAHDLVDLARSQVQAALLGQQNHPDPVALFGAVANLLNELKGDAGAPVDLQLVIELLEILPQELFAVLGQGLLLTGIDQDFVARLEQAVDDMAVVRQIIAADASQDLGFAQVRGARVAAANVGVDLTCQGLVDDREIYTLLIAGLKELGVGLRITGAIFKGLSKTTVDGDFTGEGLLLGFVGVADLTVSHGSKKMIGEVLDGLGELLIGHLDAAGGIIRRCESVIKQDTIIAQNCYLSRNRAPGCGG